MISKTSEDGLAIARRLYDGFVARDAGAILAELHDDFVGHVSAGMPLGVGGRFEGPQAMLGQVWAPIAVTYDVAPIADELLACADGRVVAIGGYRGTLRSSDERFDAAFAHLLRLRDGKVRELVQITDTASWPRPS